MLCFVCVRTLAGNGMLREIPLAILFEAAASTQKSAETKHPTANSVAKGWKFHLILSS